MDKYLEFLQRKIKMAQPKGFEVELSEIHPILKPHQRAVVQWVVGGGRRAIFASFGLGKTLMQSEFCRLIQPRAAGPALIVLPLGVRQEFKDDSSMLGMHFEFIRSNSEMKAGQEYYLTNYESVRDGKLDPNKFAVASLDEASILRSYGSKTYQEFLPLFDKVEYKAVATATPSPNRYKELIHYAGFLGIMDTGQALTRFFQRDSTQANNLTLYPHREKEFWFWLHSWAIFLQKPSDLGFPDEGYTLPPMTVHYHEVPTNHALAGQDKDGQGQLAKAFTEFSLQTVYDFEFHVRIGKELDRMGALPSSFMSLAPGSHHPNVWHDVNRMITLNGNQTQKGLQNHVCLARGSMVLTRTGYKPIESVRVGDEVLTHLGRWRRVMVAKNTGVRPVVQLHAQGVGNLVLTPDHKLWARNVRGRARARDAAMRTAPDWLAAEECKGNYINLKLPPTEISDGDATYWWMVGRWLADGHIDKRGIAHISCGRHKLGNFLKMAGRFAAGSKPRDPGTCFQIAIKDPKSKLRNTLLQCGKGAGGKQLPPAACTLDAESAKALLDGYLSGDGHFHSERGRWMMTSISRPLLLGLAMLAQRVYGTLPAVYAGRGDRDHVIDGRKVRANQEWIMSFDVPAVGRRKSPFVIEDGAWKLVREVEPKGEMETWCLRVEEDESFTAEGCIVKNCPLQFDIVDRLIERYSMPGEMVYDPFGGLMTVPYRAIKMGRRGSAAELNTQYFFDGVHYLKAAEAEFGMPSLFDFDKPETTEAAA